MWKLKRNVKYFSNQTDIWKPKIPRHRIIIDRTTYRAPHPVWNKEDAEKVEITHYSPSTLRDRLAYIMMRGLRIGFDYFTRYRPGKMTEELYLRRCIFLETIAAVPGMIGGVLRHIGSMRSMREDSGWIHHLLEEAENERMHLLAFLELRQPGIMLRLTIIFGQLIFIVYYTSLYLISYRMAHRFVGYLEEEAVKTYTNLIKELDEGKLSYWKSKSAPSNAIKYWGLSKNAKIRDMMIQIRADEVMHREFNHHFADISKYSQVAGHKYYICDEESNKMTN